MRLGHTGEKSLEAFTKQGLLKGVITCRLDFCEYCVTEKKTKVKFDKATHYSERILDYVHTDVWRPTNMTSIEGNQYFVSFIDDYSRLVEWKRTWRRVREGRSRYSIQTIEESKQAIFSYNYATMRAQTDTSQ